MSVRRVQLRRGTTAENNAFTGASGELTVDTTKKTIRVHDGATAGGMETTLPDLSNIAPTASVDINNNRVINVLDPVDAQDVATKNYVDSGGGLTIDNLTNVSITNVANAQMLIYDDDAGVDDDKWKNQTISGVVVIDNTGVVSFVNDALNGANIDTITNGSIPNLKLVHDSVTIGSTEIDLGATSTTLSGMTGIDFTNVNATIGATMTDDGLGNPTILTLGGAGSQVSITNDLDVGADLSVGANLSVTGNLTVSGTTTTINSTSVAVADRVVELQKDIGANASTLDLGLFLNRGTSADALMIWDEGANAFVLATHSGAVDASTNDYSAVAGLVKADLEIKDLRTTGALSVGTSVGITTSLSVGTTLGVTGVTTLSSLLNANGGIAVNANQFTVDSATGNTLIDGTLGVTGVSTLASGSTISTIEFTDGQIQTTNVDNNLSFNDNNLSTSGTLAVGSTSTFSDDVTIDSSKSLLIDKGATHQIVLNSDVVDDNTPANASIAVALSDAPSYATITWTNATSTWALSNNASVATDLSVGQDLTLARNLYIGVANTNGITFRHDEAGANDQTLIRVDRGANHASIAWDESSAYFTIAEGLNVVGAITQGARDGASNFSVSNTGVITSDSDGHQLAGLTFSGTTIEAFTNGAGIDFGNENVSTNGNLTSLDVTSTGNASLNTATLSGLLTANGGITADAGVFTVADVSGNVHTSGTLDADGDLTIGNDFSVTAVSGNTSVGGTLGVTSTITASAQGHTLANFTINNSQITSATQTISLGNNDLSTTGDVSATDITSSGVASLATTNVSGNTTITDATFTIEDVNNADKFVVSPAGVTTIHGLTTLKDDLNLESTSGGVVFRSETGAGVDGDQNLLSVIKGAEGTAVLSWVSGTDTFTISDNFAITGTTTLTGDLSLDTATLTGLLSADGGIDVDGVFTVAGDGSGNVATTGTASFGATSVTSLDVNNNDINNVGGIYLDTIQRSADANTFDILLKSAEASSLEIKEGGNLYQTFDTSVGTEKVVFGKLITAPTSSVIANLTFTDNTISSGGGAIDFAGASVTSTGGALTVGSIDVAGGDITNVGDLALDTMSSAGTTITIDLNDKQPGAFQIVEGFGGNNTPYVKLDTTDGSELITLSQATTIVGVLTANGGITADGGVFAVANDTGAVSTQSTISAYGTLTLDDVSQTASPNLVVKEHTANATTFEVLGASGNTTISGTLNAGATTITGATSITGVTSIDGATTISGNFTIDDGALPTNVFTVDSTNGNTTISGTLGAGATSLSGNLDLNANNIDDVTTLSVGTIQAQSNTITARLTTAQGSALLVEDSNNVAYQTFVTSVGTERVAFGKRITAPDASTIGSISFSGDQITSNGGTISLNADALSTTGALTVGSIDVAGGDITNVGDVALNSISADGASISIDLNDQQPGAFQIVEGLGGNNTPYVKIDTTEGAELITFSQNVQFTGTASFTSGAIGLDGGDVVVNESGNANDFRVEGDNQTHLLFTDGTNDRVGVNTNAPATQLHVVGTTTQEGILTQKSGAVSFNTTQGDHDFTISGQTKASLFVADASLDQIAIDGTLTLSGKGTLAGSLDLTTASTEGITFRSEIAENGASGDQDLLSVNNGGTDGAGAPNYVKVLWDSANSRFEVESGLKSAGDFVVGSDVVTIDSASGNTELSGVLSIKSSDLGANENNQSAIVLLNSDATGAGAERDAKIEVERGTLTNAYIQWDESEDEWLVSNALNSAGNLTIGADKLTVDASTGNTSIGGTLGVTSAITASAQGHTLANFTINNDSIVSGNNAISFDAANLTTTGSVTCTNLTVNGTLTTINSTDLEVTDSIIRLNKGAGLAANNTRDIGIFMERGSDEDDAIFFFDEDDSIFKMGLTQTASTGTDFTEPTTWGALKIGTLATTSTITADGVVNANGGLAIDTAGFTIDGANYKLTSTGDVQITNTSANAFLVETALGGDIFKIDTDTPKVTITSALFEPDAGIDVGAGVFSVSSAGVTSILNTLNVTKTSTTALVVETDAGVDVLNVDTTNSVVSVTGQLKTNDLRALTTNSGDFKIRLKDNLPNALEVLDDGNGDSFITFTTTTGSELITFGQNITASKNLLVSGNATFAGELSIQSTNANGIVFNSDLSGAGAEAGDINLLQIERGTTGADGILKWDENAEEFNLNLDTHFQGDVTFGGATSANKTATLTTGGALSLDTSLTTPLVTLDTLTDNTGNGMVFQLADGEPSGLVVRQGSTGELYLTFNTLAETATLHQATTISGALTASASVSVGTTLDVTGVTTLTDSLALKKSVADTGIIFNSDRAVGDVPNATDFDAILLHVENGGAVGAVDAFVKWDDSESSFTIDGGAFHVNSAFSVGTNISTQNFTVSTSGAVTQSGSLTLDDIGDAVSPDFTIVNAGGSTTFEVLGASGNTTIEGTLEVTGQTTLDERINVLSGFTSSALYVNSNLTGAGQEADAGLIEVERGTETNASFSWNETDNTFDFFSGVTSNNGRLQLGVAQITSDTGTLSFGSNALTTSGNVSTTAGGTLIVDGATTLSSTLEAVGVATFKADLNIQSTNTNGVVFNSERSALASVDANLITIERGTTGSDVVVAWDETNDELNFNAQTSLHLQGKAGANALTIGDTTSAGTTTATLTTAGALTLSSTLSAPTLSTDVISDKSSDGLYVQLADNQSSGFVVRQGTGNLGDAGTEYYLTLTTTNGAEKVTLHQDTDITGILTISGNIRGTGAHVSFNDGLVFLGNGNLFANQKDLGIHFQYSDSTFNDKFFGGLIYKPGAAVGGQGGVFKVFHGYDTIDLSAVEPPSLTIEVPDADLAPIDAKSVRGGEASGQDQAGSNLTISGGASTGTGAGGSIVFETTSAGASSSNVNSASTALTIDSAQKAVFEGEVEAKRSGTAYPIITTKASEGSRYECASVASGATLSAPAAIENKHAYFINNGASAGTLTLFALSGATYDGYVVQIINQGTNTIVVSGNGGQLINGNPSVNLNTNASLSLIAYGTAWYII
jgi:fibronectin-binding autotransporter adhesin